MSVQLLGKPAAAAIYDTLTKAIGDAQPCLHVLLVGSDPASRYYVGNIARQAAKVGVSVVTEEMPAEVGQNTLLQRIAELNADPAVHGMMVQRPLPANYNDRMISEAIDPCKDVDGAHPLNAGRLMLEQQTLVPATAQAVVEMLRYYSIPTSGKQVTIVGRSAVIGRPLANLMLYKGEPGNATVTVCHSRTPNLAEETVRADILVAAIGRPRYITAEMVQEGAVVIDVGVNEIEEDGKTAYVGDVDFAAVQGKASAITPVPGGVGTLTTACLIRNVFYAFQRQI